MSSCPAEPEQLGAVSNLSSPKNVSKGSPEKCSSNQPDGERIESCCLSSSESEEISSDLCDYDDLYENAVAMESNPNCELFESEELREFREQRFREVMRSKFKPSRYNLLKTFGEISMQDGKSDKNVISDDSNSSSDRADDSKDNRLFFCQPTTSEPRDPLDDLHEAFDRLTKEFLDHFFIWEQMFRDSKLTNLKDNAKMTNSTQRVVQAMKTFQEIQEKANRETARIEENLTETEDDIVLSRTLSAERLQEKIRDTKQILQNMSLVYKKRCGISLETNVTEGM